MQSQGALTLSREPRSLVLRLVRSAGSLLSCLSGLAAPPRTPTDMPHGAIGPHGKLQVKPRLSLLQRLAWVWLSEEELRVLV